MAYSVKLEKAQAVVLCEASDETIFILDDKRQTDLNRQDGDGNYWRFGGDRPTVRLIGITCLKDKDVGASFMMRLEEEETFANRHIGTLKATIEQAEGKIKLSFEDKGGLVAAESGRAVEDGDVYWIGTLARPDQKPGKYKLSFKITQNIDQ